jgi:hypothetical protein
MISYIVRRFTLLEVHRSPILSEIHDEWESLLDDQSNPEEIYHQYLIDFSGFFFPQTTKGIMDFIFLNYILGAVNE